MAIYYELVCEKEYFESVYEEHYFFKDKDSALKGQKSIEDNFSNTYIQEISFRELKERIPVSDFENLFDIYIAEPTSKTKEMI